jgi:hypothetical protein
MKTQSVERLHSAVSFLMTSMGSPQHRLVMATYYLETITDVPSAIAKNLPIVIGNLRRLRNPEEVWGEKIPQRCWCNTACSNVGAAAGGALPVFKASMTDCATRRRRSRHRAARRCLSCSTSGDRTNLWSFRRGPSGPASGRARICGRGGGVAADHLRGLRVAG